MTTTHLNAEKISAMDIHQLAKLHDALLAQGIEESAKAHQQNASSQGLLTRLIQSWNGAFVAHQRQRREQKMRESFRTLLVGFSSMQKTCTVQTGSSQ